MSSSTPTPAPPTSSAQSQPTSQPPAPTLTNPTAPPTTKPPLNIHPSAHLDPQAYILGTHPITLGADVITHPRARLVSVHGPLTIGAGSVVYERCVVGGPGVDPRDRLPPPTSSLAGEPLRTVIGENVHLSASAEIEAGTCLEDACLIESRAMIKKGVKVGKHSKVCAGCVVDRDVGEWVVVWGDGEARRMRKGAEVPEMGRLKALEREREATVGLLRAAAARATLGKRRG